jgi:hypothetical protein
MTPCFKSIHDSSSVRYISRFIYCVRSDVRLPLDTTIRIRQDRIFYILV